MQLLGDPELRLLPAPAIHHAPGRVAHQPAVREAILVLDEVATAWFRGRIPSPGSGTQKMSSDHAQIWVPATRLLSIIRA